MKAVLKVLVLVPLAVIVTIFAVAHRDPVVMSWNPLDRADPAYQLTVPLFAPIFVTLAIGIMIGSLGTWLAQGRYRKAARANARTADQQKRDIDRLTSARELTQLPPPSMLR